MSMAWREPNKVQVRMERESARAQLESEYDSFTEWGSLGIDTWKPGMGAFCAYQDHRNRKHFGCGVPAARVRSRRDGKTRIVCATHLANVLLSMRTRSHGKSVSGEAVKRANEALIVKYWDEHQALIDSYVDEVTQEELAHLPPELIDAIKAAEELLTNP